jgi:hypothetical protein
LFEKLIFKDEKKEKENSKSKRKTKPPITKKPKLPNEKRE